MRTPAKEGVIKAIVNGRGHLGRSFQPLSAKRVTRFGLPMAVSEGGCRGGGGFGGRGSFGKPRRRSV